MYIYKCNKYNPQSATQTAPLNKGAKVIEEDILPPLPKGGGAKHRRVLKQRRNKSMTNARTLGTVHTHTHTHTHTHIYIMQIRNQKNKQKHR